ncbi:hypothetical protein CVIRNUC_007156 [Coccomyxa viridis]|uniref:S1 motif domain-containing protein n=1 Tax=Coccomyxa viridis TaxID=1274662 RepID=A0AAV1I9S1_9CHLO|nr:hypothetical protein CVIRNUC_007156 [Coccomyxa viridis]
MHCSTQGASLLPAAARIRHSNVHAPLRVVARSHSLAQRKRAAARHTLAASANIQEQAQSATDEEQDHQSESLNEVPSPAAHEASNAQEDTSTSSLEGEEHRNGENGHRAGPRGEQQQYRGGGSSQRTQPMRRSKPGGQKWPPLSQHAPEPAVGHTLKEGDVVVGRVIRSHAKGANIELLDDPRILGYMVVQDGPFLMRDTLNDPSQMLGYTLPVGLVREFLVRHVDPDMEFYGRGPLLSCKYMDASTLWHRAEQIAQVLEEEREVLRVMVNNANNGGLLSVLDGLPAFVPFSLVPKAPNERLTVEDLKSRYLGRHVPVTIREVSRADRKITFNMVEAAQILAYRSVKVGALVSGHIRRIEPYGALVAIDDTRISGLLHISRISRAHVENVFDLFHEGDRVRCLVTFVDEGSHKISLSTSDLEEVDGDMILNQEKVLAAADDNLAAALERMERRAEEEAMYGGERRGRQGNRNDSFDFDGDFRR